MSEDFDDIVDNLSQASSWLRILFMFAFATVLYLVIAPLLLVLMIAQALFSLFSGDSNRNLRYLGDSLCIYVTQIFRFITYNSEDKPFPFSDFPSPEENDAANDEAKVKPKTKAKAKRPARKKTAARKKKPGPEPPETNED